MNEPVTGIALGVVIVGLALSTFVTRTSFMLAGARLRLNHRIETALRYAPVCTLMAIIVPDVLLHGGQSYDFSLLNPRLIGALASAAIPASGIAAMPAPGNFAAAAFNSLRFDLSSSPNFESEFWIRLRSVCRRLAGSFIRQIPPEDSDFPVNARSNSTKY